jgi:hypothetical protein
VSKVRHDVIVTDPLGALPTRDALEYIDSRAPEDVRRAISWLQEEGWQPASASGGVGAPFGDILIEFIGNRTGVRIIQDRSQWVMDVRPTGCSEWFDFGILLDTMTGREEWTSGHELPSQLPPGVDWANTLPEVLAWLSSTSNIASKIRETRLKRFRARFPRRG